MTQILKTEYTPTYSMGVGIWLKHLSYVF